MQVLDFFASFVLLFEVAKVSLDLLVALFDALADLPRKLFLLIFLLALDVLESGGVVNAFACSPRMQALLLIFSCLLHRIHLVEHFQQSLLLNLLLVRLFESELLLDSVLSLTGLLRFHLKLLLP